MLPTCPLNLHTHSQSLRLGQSALYNLDFSERALLRPRKERTGSVMSADVSTGDYLLAAM